MGKRGVAFNARFLTVSPSGVQRVAEELIKHLDALLRRETAPDRSWALVSPCGTARDIDLEVMATEHCGRLSGLLWEQAELPWLAGRRLLVNLCNQAPLLRKGDIVMIHDAQVFLSPQSYSWAFRLWYRFVLPRIAHKASRVITVSHYSRDRLIEYGVAPASKISVIHNGVDHMGFTAADERCLLRMGLAPKSYVVALASTQKHKNIAVLLAAFRGAHPPATRLVLVGAHGEAAFTAQGMVLPDNILFTGKVTDGELRALYEGALCLAFPSTTEGFGLPPLEAMLVGCPAIVAPCGALPEVCGDVVLYVSPDDAEGWAQAIRSLADDPAARAELIRRGRLQAALFTWDRSARRLFDLILDVVDRRQSGPNSVDPPCGIAPAHD